MRNQIRSATGSTPGAGESGESGTLALVQDEMDRLGVEVERVAALPNKEHTEDHSLRTL